MGDAGFFRGTSTEQDSRFSNKEKKLLKSMTFPSDFSKKVDLSKVNTAVLKPWIAKKVTELLDVEDEVLVDYIFHLLEEEKVDPKNMQINLTGFLEDKAPEFMKELWALLLSAQNSVGGIPKEFLDVKKEEILKRKNEDELLMEQIRKVRERLMDEKLKRPASPETLGDNHRHSRPKEEERESRHRGRGEEKKPRRHRSRSGERGHRHRRRKSRSKSRSRSRSRDRGGRRERRHRSRSRDKESRPREKRRSGKDKRSKRSRSRSRSRGGSRSSSSSKSR